MQDFSILGKVQHFADTIHFLTQNLENSNICS